VRNILFSFKNLLVLIFLLQFVSCSYLSKHSKRAQDHRSFLLEYKGSEELTALSNQEPNFGARTMGQRKVQKKQAWQWRSTFAIGAAPQSYSRIQFVQGLKILISTLGGGLECRDVQSNKIYWKAKFPMGVAADPYVDGSSVAFISLDGEFQKRRLSDGQIMWQKNFNAGSYASVVGDQSNYYLVGAHERVVALNKKTGEVAWQSFHKSERSERWSLRGQGRGAVDLSGKRLYLGFSDGYVKAFATDSGRVQWKRHFSKRDSRFQDVDLDLLLNKSKTTLYLCTIDGDLLALSARSGSTLWRHPARCVSAPLYVAEEEALYFYDGFGHVKKLSAKNGTELWSNNLALKAYVSTPVAVGKNLLAFTESAGGKLYLLDRKNGSLQKARQVARGILAPPAFNGRDLFLLSPRNHLHHFQYRQR